jgi:hypothetical protein
MTFQEQNCQIAHLQNLISKTSLMARSDDISNHQKIVLKRKIRHYQHQLQHLVNDRTLNLMTNIFVIEKPYRGDAESSCR